MYCEVCGQEFLVRHSCPGKERVAPPQGFAPLRYLREACRIVLWDAAAIRRVMDDPRSLGYGVLFWAIGNTLPSLVFTYFGPIKSVAPGFARVASQMALGLLSAAILGLLQLATIHLVAKFFCAGEGKFVQILRPLSLASLILLLQAIPAFIGIFTSQISWASLFFAGFVVGHIAWVAVMVMVFDVVDGMDQLAAFVTSMAAVFGLDLVPAIKAWALMASATLASPCGLSNR